VKIPVTPATLLRALTLTPLYIVLTLTGGDFDGLIEWWIRSQGGARAKAPEPIVAGPCPRPSCGGVYFDTPGHRLYHENNDRWSRNESARARTAPSVAGGSGQSNDVADGEAS
jgi:hypothetical protein